MAFINCLFKLLILQCVVRSTEQIHAISTYTFGAVTKMSGCEFQIYDICLQNDLKTRPLCVLAHIGKGLPNGKLTEQLIILKHITMSK